MIHFRKHVIHCKELPIFKYRHDFISEVLFDIETLVNFLTDPHEGISTLRPTNILVYEWVGGKHACVILIGVFTPVGSEDLRFYYGTKNSQKLLHVE